MPVYLTAAEVAQLLKLSRATVRRMVRDGRLPKPAKLGRAVTSPLRFDRAKIEEAVLRQTAE
jgi:excisionase family DNA binding protein